jgi:hypothetical protein
LFLYCFIYYYFFWSGLYCFIYFLHPWYLTAVNTDIGSCALSISETQLESRKATRADGGRGAGEGTGSMYQTML